MKLPFRGLLVFSLALLLAAAVSAEEKKKEAPKKPAVNPIFTFNKNMKPAATEDQIKKLAELEKEYAPQLAELSKKAIAVITPERAKVAGEARKKALEEGKKGKDVQAAVDAALKLSDDEKKTLKELNSARGKLNQEIGKKKAALLTDEQKESIKPKAKPKKDAK